MNSIEKESLMNRLQRGITAALASVVIGAPAIAQTTTPSTTAPTAAPTTGPNGAPMGAMPNAGRPTSITPGNTGTMPPSTTAGTMGTGGPTVPGTTTNTPLQRSPDNTTSAAPPAVTTSNANQKTAAAPVKGRNSFTMNEARRRIEAGGFTKVTGLKKDQDGIWRGTGMRNGASVPVYCDYQGNVGAS